MSVQITGQYLGVKMYQVSLTYAEQRNKKLTDNELTQKVKFSHIDGSKCSFPRAYLENRNEQFYILFTEHHGYFILDKDEVKIKVDGKLVHKGEVFA
jgi:hypothetical protein